jgi:hypothetical protein
MKQQHKQSVYLTHPRMPAFVHGILNMPRPSSLGGGLIGLFLLTWVSLWAQVAQAGTIWNLAGPVTGDPIDTTHGNTVPDSDALDLTVTNFTVSACVYQTRRNSSYSSAILTKRGSENGWGLLLEGKSGTLGDTGIVKFRSLHTGKSSTVKSDVVVSSQALSLNTWYHIAVVYQGGYAQIFINGNLDSGGNLPAPMASEKVLRIGGDFDSLTNQPRYGWYGKLSNLQIDNTALSQSQIQTLCQACGNGISCVPVDPCKTNPPAPGCSSEKPTYNPTTGVIYIPQLTVNNGLQTCKVYLLQQPYTLNFLLDASKLECQ